MAKFGQLTWRLIWDRRIPVFIKLLLLIIPILLLILIWLSIFLLLPIWLSVFFLWPRHTPRQVSEDEDSIPVSYRVEDERQTQEPQGYIESPSDKDR